MANNFRIPFKNAVIAQDLPTSGAGSAAGDPVRNNGLNGINLWGTGKGQGVPAGSDYGMIALDGVAVVTIAGTGALTENAPVYITSGNVVTRVATDNTLFGYLDEPIASGAGQVAGVRISNAVGA